MPSYRHCFLDSLDRVAEFHVIASETDGVSGTEGRRAGPLGKRQYA